MEALSVLDEKEISYNLKGVPVKHKIFNYDEKQSLKSLKIIEILAFNANNSFRLVLSTKQKIQSSSQTCFLK